MTKVSFSEYTVRYYNLTRFSGLLIGRIGGSHMVSNPSQFITRKDGGMTVQSRTTDTGTTIPAYAMKYATFTGILPNGTVETLSIS